MKTKVAIICSYSDKIINTAKTTVINKIEYCLIHRYSFILDCLDYNDAVSSTDKLIALFDKYDLLWCLDMDTMITNMSYKIEDLDCLGKDVTLCEERAFGINCGSIVYKNTENTKWFLRTIAENKSEWENLGLIWQEWILNNYKKFEKCLTVAPLRSFNSCSLPAWYGGPEVSDWHYGDFVYHACGAKEKQIPLLNYISNYVKY